MAAHFAADVSAGRKMGKSAVKKLATGRTWIAGDALALGLVDRVTGAPRGTVKKTMASR